ncbi:hypothetical protein AGMMS50225_11020 [Betaproteobacteria bacterium]|nr:hypothetical protein AGMMS50225_11020 [Betaproteobacteria bacterium]
MMSRFDAALNALEAETGWKPVADEADAPATARFDLAGLSFSMAAPDDRHLYFTYRLAELASDEDAQARARGYARMAAAAFRTRHAALSLYQRAFYLSQEVDLTAIDVADVPVFCQKFLNDCDWWRENSPAMNQG